MKRFEFTINTAVLRNQNDLGKVNVMSNVVGKIDASDEAWDSGELGFDEAHVGVVKEDIESMINESLDLRPVSIRLQKSLIEDFKMIAGLHGIGYQPLMRQVLTRFADCEKKNIIRQTIAERKKA